jgi:hypothetical protein
MKGCPNQIVADTKGDLGKNGIKMWMWSLDYLQEEEKEEKE